MSQSVPMEPHDQGDAAVADYRQQSREFLVKSRGYLERGDLHQAAEKGWGAAAWMAKAVAEARGWQYSKHEQFFTVMYEARHLSSEPRLRSLTAVVNTMHGYYYTRKRFLRSEVIGAGLNDVALLLDILQPLTEGS